VSKELPVVKDPVNLLEAHGFPVRNSYGSRHVMNPLMSLDTDLCIKYAHLHGDFVAKLGWVITVVLETQVVDYFVATHKKPKIS